MDSADHDVSFGGCGGNFKKHGHFKGRCKIDPHGSGPLFFSALQYHKLLSHGVQSGYLEKICGSFGYFPASAAFVLYSQPGAL